MSSTNNGRDPAANQLKDWQEKKKQSRDCTSTTDSYGIPTVKRDVSITVGKNGPMVMYDANYFDQMGHFDRERIPERVVHAKGGGAFGYFEVTDDITEFTSSTVFEYVGKRTQIAVRFSQVAGNLGSADTVRDPRGFAVKFYTEEGIWDLVGNNTPIFFMRDPKLFPMFIHSQKRNPATNLRDWDMFWDYLSLRPESTHQVLILFSDRGIPDGWRHMHGYGSHTFSMINKDQQLTYVKYHYLTDQGIKNLTNEEATRLAGTDPDYAVRDLYNAIAREDYPSWTLYIQTATPEETKDMGEAAFDITKIWNKKKFSLKRVGKIVLTRNPKNFFAEIEQLAFSPSNLTPGLGASPDRLLQGRFFSYPDTHTHRLGANSQQLPVNSAMKVCNFQRDGLDAHNNQGGAPNYHPNSFGGPEDDPLAATWTAPPLTVTGKMTYNDISDWDNFSQPRDFYVNTLDEERRGILIDNLADSLRQACGKIRDRAIGNFGKVHEELASRIKARLRTLDISS